MLEPLDSVRPVVEGMGRGRLRCGLPRTARASRQPRHGAAPRAAAPRSQAPPARPGVSKARAAARSGTAVGLPARPLPGDRSRREARAGEIDHRTRPSMETKARLSALSSTRRTRRLPSPRAEPFSPRRAGGARSSRHAASIASASSRSATVPSGSVSAQVIAARHSTPAAGSSTRSSTACRSGRRSITSRARRPGSTARRAEAASAQALRSQRCHR